jgi:hypothetical protein
MSYSIEPAHFEGTRLPGYGTKYANQDLFDRVHQDGPAAFDALKEALSNPKSGVERRYCAMGFLVALYNYNLLAASDVLPVLDDVIRSSIDERYNQTRRDALGALASLYSFASEDDSANPGILRLISIAQDPRSQENLRRDALLTLAERRHKMSTKTLAWGVLELRDATDRFVLARALGEGPETWSAKAGLFVSLLANGSKDRSEIDSGAVLHALRSEDEPWTRRLGPLADFFIHSAEGADDRMSGNLAELLVECFGGNPDQAGYAINQYERNHKLPESSLKGLRIQVGGAPALSGIVKVLKDDLDKYFQQPIHKLNDDTMDMWQDTLKDARRGFQARIWMSIAVFCLGVLLVLSACYTIIFAKDSTEFVAGSYGMVASGLVIMLLVIYTGPLKEIRQSVTDLATASAAFIAYVHRVLETSHTFSYYYLTEKISFDEMKRSSALMSEAMSNTIDALSRKAVDSSQEVFERASELLLKQRGNAQDDLGVNLSQSREGSASKAIRGHGSATSAPSADGDTPSTATPPSVPATNQSSPVAQTAVPPERAPHSPQTSPTTPRAA